MILRRGLALLFAIGASAVSAEEPPPFAGCYAQNYDAAHMRAHPRQIVRQVKLLVGRTNVPQTPGEKQRVVADASLVVTVSKERFSTIGACVAEAGALLCNAALSAEETRLCKTKADGVRDCRLSSTDAGAFVIAPRGDGKGDGMSLAIRERLELPGPMDRTSFLYLSPGNSANHAFDLPRAPDAVCK